MAEEDAEGEAEAETEAETEVEVQLARKNMTGTLTLAPPSPLKVHP